jgi:glycosyltransferase 2 family protein
LSRTGLYLPIIGFIAFITIAWKYFDYEKVGYYLRLADLSLIIVVIILTSTQIVTATLRYNFFLKACGAEIKIKDCMHAVLTALSINSVVPAKGGDIAKAIVLTKDKHEILKYTGVTVIEKLCDLIVLSVITFIGAFLVKNDFWQSVSLGSIILFISLFLFLRFVDKLPILGSKLQVLPELVKNALQNQKFFLSGIFFCILLWVVNLTIIFLLLMSVDADVSLSKIISYWPSSMLTGMLPITISGFGTRDVAFAYVLGESIDNTRIFAATFLYTVFVYWFLSLLAFLILTIKGLLNLRAT